MRYIGAIGPDDRFQLGIDPGLMEEIRIGQGLKHGSPQLARQVNPPFSIRDAP